MTTLKPVQGQRGLCAFAPITADRGTTVKVYESSDDSAPKIYVHMAEPPSFDDPSGREIAASMTLEQVQVLSDQLSWFLQNHYQIKA